MLVLRSLLILAPLLLASLGLVGAPVPSFVFEGQRVLPGHKLQVLLTVVAGPDTAVVPVTVVHGRRQGPVLGVVAGVHGCEYAPIVAAQQLAQSLDADQLSGTVLVVHLANVPGFLGRRIHDNPQDDKNLNRTFPGRPAGTITERLAWRLGEAVIGRCTHLVDVHAGDAHEELRPYAAYYNYSDTGALTAQGRQMAAALGFAYVVQFANEPRLAEASLYCSREAIARGIPAVDIECGGLGQATAGDVAQITQALGRLLHHLRLLDGAVAAGPAPYFIAQRTTVSSAHTGFFYPQVRAGEFVSKGSRLGRATDLFGNPLPDVLCPVDGVVLYLSAAPPISRGEGLFSIGHVAAQP